MNKAAFIVPFFGNLPSYLPLFLRGCNYNLNNVDILFYTNCQPPQNLPSNIKWQMTDLNSFFAKAEDVLNFDVTVKDLHKICDFRPFYGLMYEKELANYNFWGYCDIDVVFGDLSLALNEDLFNNYDVFTAHYAQAAGHFTMMRNSDFIKNIGFKIKNYRERLNSLQTTFMDEWDMAELFQSTKELRVKRPQKLDIELPHGKSLHNITYRHNASIAYVDSRSTLTMWKNGKAYYHYNGTYAEVLYIHFMGIKRPYFWDEFNQEALYDQFYFSKIGFSLHEPNEKAFGFTLSWFLISIKLNARKWIGQGITRLFNKDFKRKLVLLFRK